MVTSEEDREGSGGPASPPGRGWAPVCPACSRGSPTWAGWGRRGLDTPKNAVTGRMDGHTGEGRPAINDLIQKVCPPKLLLPKKKSSIVFSINCSLCISFSFASTVIPSIFVAGVTGRRWHSVWTTSWSGYAGSPFPSTFLFCLLVASGVRCINLMGLADIRRVHRGEMSCL